MKTPKELKDAFDWAEYFPGSGDINFGEVGYCDVVDFVEWRATSGLDPNLKECDIESIKIAILHWWKEENKKARK